MQLSKELENALSDLKRITGIPFSIDGDQITSQAELAAMISQVSQAYKEKNNRSSIIKQWITNNLSELDFIAGAKRFHIEDNVDRVVYIIEVNEDVLDLALTVLKNLYPKQSNLWFIPITKSQIAAIYTCHEVSPLKIDKTAYEFADSLNMELMTNVKISRSSMIHDLISLKDAYYHADTILRIGKIFFPDQNVYNHASLGMGEIIYHVPESVCRNFILENLGPKALSSPPVSFRDELLNTANSFLTHSLNIAETSRQLHMHRNTLLYRLEQIHNDCGLDLRSFEDAMTFKICSLIYCYLNSEK